MRSVKINWWLRNGNDQKYNSVTESPAPPSGPSNKGVPLGFRRREINHSWQDGHWTLVWFSFLDFSSVLFNIIEIFHASKGHIAIFECLAGGMSTYSLGLHFSFQIVTRSSLLVFLASRRINLKGKQFKRLLWNWQLITVANAWTDCYVPEKSRLRLQI